MSEPFAPVDAPYPGLTGLSRLRSLIGRPSCPPRPTDELLTAWHTASATELAFDEWCDPAARELLTTLRSALGGAVPPFDVPGADEAVARFAQARAGADHTAAAVAADLAALVELVDNRHNEASGRGTAQVSQASDAISVLARGLTAWATAQVQAVTAEACTDSVTGLVTADFLRARVRELHAQCDALAIAPPMTFGSLVVQLDVAAAAVTDRIAARLAISRLLKELFRSGETVASVDSERFVAVMPAYALGRGEEQLRSALEPQRRPVVDLASIGVEVARQSFADDAEATWLTLAGFRSGP